MTAFTDLIRQVSVTVSSPDRNIVGGCRYTGGADFGFVDPDRFDEYDANSMAWQLGNVLRGLAAGNERAVRAVFDKAERTVRPPGPHPDAHRRRYRAALAALNTDGISRGRTIAIAARGTDEYSLSISDSALAKMDARKFIDELRSAYADLMRDRGVKLRALKREFFP